jgi:hypothetical protein
MMMIVWMLCVSGSKSAPRTERSMMRGGGLLGFGEFAAHHVHVVAVFREQLRLGETHFQDGDGAGGSDMGALSCSS